MVSGSRVLVAGGTGFIGANLIKRLLTEGAQVRSTLHHRPPLIGDERVEYLQADLTTLDDCRRAVDSMDSVFMCAASTSGAAVMTATPPTSPCDAQCGNERSAHGRGLQRQCQEVPVHQQQRRLPTH